MGPELRCAWCGDGRWLEEKHWFKGFKIAWWCGLCLELTVPVPPEGE